MRTAPPRPGKNPRSPLGAPTAPLTGKIMGPPRTQMQHAQNPAAHVLVSVYRPAQIPPVVALRHVDDGPMHGERLEHLTENNNPQIHHGIGFVRKHEVEDQFSLVGYGRRVFQHKIGPANGKLEGEVRVLESIKFLIVSAGLLRSPVLE